MTLIQNWIVVFFKWTFTLVSSKNCIMKKKCNSNQTQNVIFGHYCLCFCCFGRAQSWDNLRYIFVCCLFVYIWKFKYFAALPTFDFLLDVRRHESWQVKYIWTKTQISENSNIIFLCIILRVNFWIWGKAASLYSRFCLECLFQ